MSKTAAEVNAEVEASDEEAASRVRFNEQAALMMNIDQIIKMVPEGEAGGVFRAAKKYKNFIKFVSSSPEAVGHLPITNAIYRNESMQYLFNSTTNAILSSILPSIELYKVFYPTSKDKGYPWRIPFDDTPVDNGITTSAFVKDSIDELLKGSGRMHGVGIKSFKYKFVGTNPAEVNTNIEAELQLYFQDVRDLVKRIEFSKDDKNFFQNPENAITVVNEKDEKVSLNYSFSYSDLVTDESVSAEQGIKKTLRYNPQYFRLQAIIGYSEPDENLLSSLDPIKKELIKKAINSSKVILYLNPHSHDISFEENGSVTITIQYIAAMSSILQSVDTLAISDLHQKVVEKQQEYDDLAAGRKKDIDLIKNSCNINQEQKQKQVEDAQKKLEEELLDYQTELENNKNALYSGLFQILLGIKQLPASSGDTISPKVYTIDFNKYALGAVPSIGKDEVLKDAAQQRIASLSSAGGARQQIDPKSYKIVSAADIDKETLALSNSPNASGKVYALGPISSADIESISDKVKDKLGITNSIASERFDSYFGINVFKSIAQSFGHVDVDGTKKAAKEQLEKQIKRGEKSQFPDDKDGRYPVQFVFLGDILDVCADQINNKNPSERPRMILCDFNLEIPNAPSGTLAEGLSKVDSVFNTDATYEKFKINIADIPISLDMLQNFFLEKIIKPGKNSYPLVSFINDIMTDIVIPAVSPAVFGRKTVLNRGIRLAGLPITLPFSGPRHDLDTLTRAPASQPFGGLIDESFLQVLKIHDTSLANIGATVGNYYIMYCSNQLPATLKGNKGDEEKDNKDGVYHFFVGSDKGLIKKINFSRQNSEFAKEARNTTNSSGQKSLGRLREVYDANITMFGNNVYRPSDYIFVEPLFFVGQEAIDLRSKIGLGGYYQVIDSTVTINENIFETVLNTVVHGIVEGGEVIELSNPRSC